ncbi:mediator complex subunit [Saitozyma podzolica]|uniref:Mediator of RNA polymerase II transcription subunit 5 n=1 Tax=Saitozyma podzolica TaxID=1890683 RepID=A0A427YW01_9TREE|nr:mediator complex subunit [Saitozyma podzolica]
MARSDFVRIIQSWEEDHQEDTAAHESALAAALLKPLVSSSPPAILLGYLTQSLSSSLITARTISLQLLLLLSEPGWTPSSIASVAGAILANPTGLAQGEPLPSSLETAHLQDVPDVGTSASASQPAITAVPTLSFILPLLRLCSNPTEPAPFPIVALINRLLSLLQPYPAPPLDVGLEASALLPVLPDVIATPLRNCLGGLMADVAMSQDVAQMQISVPSAAFDVSSRGITGGGLAKTADDGSVTPLTRVWTAPRQSSPIPIQHAIDFLFAHALRSSRWTRSSYPPSNPPEPWQSHIEVLRIGRYLCPEPDRFLLQLIETSLKACLNTYQALSSDFVDRFLILTEALPTLLRSWKDNGDADWSYPDSLKDILTTAVGVLTADLTAYQTFMTDTYASRVSDAEADDESGGFSPIDGWTVASLQETFVRRLVDAGLLSSEEAGAVLLGSSPPQLPAGESLMYRLASAPKSHLPALVQTVIAAPGAPRSFATEVVNSIAACPQTQPPENLFVALAAQPALLAALSAVMPPASLLDHLVEKLLDPPDNESARADDPQGSLARFGEGVMLVESVVALFDLPLPKLLQRARCAVGLADLSVTEKTCMSGWVKALFGSDGIDDQILLSTVPADFCWLSTSVIQQAIAATAAGAIDRDTLHSGLSYFSQPLLSWSLGGIVAWLCQEIERQGLISALHLDVLQNLVLGESFPEALLRINAAEISRLLRPTSHLQPVFESSGFVVAGVTARLEVFGPDPSLTKGPIDFASNVLRADLQVVRRLDIAQNTWANPLLSALEDSLTAEGTSRTLDVLVSELLQPSMMDFDRTNGDPLAYFAPVLCAIRICPTLPVPLALEVVDGYLPRMFDDALHQANSGSAHILAALLKGTLILTAELYPMKNTADVLAEHVVEELL